MTLEDAVAYYSEIAKECRLKARIESNDYMDMRDATYEAEQLADWLNELIVLRERIEDLISRRAAISEIEQSIINHDSAIMRITNLPPVQAEPKWIPCDESLPEENMWAICQNDAGAMMIGKYDIEFGWMFPAYFDGIVAWMPRPEPYKAERKADG